MTRVSWIWWIIVCLALMTRSTRAIRPPFQARARRRSMSDVASDAPDDDAPSPRPTLSPQNIAAFESSHQPIDASSQFLLRQSLLWAIPVVSTITAFVFFKHMTHAFHAIVETLSHHSWIPKTPEEVDLQTQVITQVINGPVITSISVLFATLVTTTVSSLFHRQLEIRSAFTDQIDTIRHLYLLLTNIPTALREELRPHLDRYTSTLVQEEHHGAQKSRTATTTNAHAMDPSTRSLLLILQRSMTTKSNPIMTQAYDAVLQLIRLRSQRFKALQTKFPTMHYAALALMASTVCVAFLIATDQSQQIFESLQVRLLWCILVGAFTSLAVVCFDLSSPFVGAYQVSHQFSCSVVVVVVVAAAACDSCGQCHSWLYKVDSDIAVLSGNL
jgi:hypothetical protein